MTKRKLLKDEVKLLPAATREVFDRFLKHNKEIYLVGAGVRAILRNQKPIDGDFTTNATPEEILAITAEWEPFYDNAYGTVGIPVGEDEKLKGGVKEKEVYEITPYRTEQGYSDTRRPDQVTWGTSLEEDVKRRDFTMNAIVMGPKMNETEAGEEYELIDYHQGLKDFEAGIIRAVGNPSERFAEDALRMMRAVRFAAQLGFSIEPTTLKGLVEQAPLLKKISRERVRDELMKILGSDHPADGIQLLTNSGLMEFIIPELLAGRGVTQTGHHHSDVYTHLVESLRACPSSDPLVRLATLLHDIAKPATRKLRCFKCGWVMKENNLVHMGESAKLTQYKCPRCGGLQSEHQAATFYAHEVAGARMATEIGERLRLSRKEIDKLTTLVRWHMFSYDPTMTDAAIRRFIRRVGVENINDLILLRIGDRKGSGAQTTSWRLMELQKRVGEQLYQPMTTNDLAIDGNEIMKELNIKPGPLVGKILNALFEEVIEDTDKNNREYLMERTKKLVKEIEV